GVERADLGLVLVSARLRARDTGNRQDQDDPNACVAACHEKPLHRPMRNSNRKTGTRVMLSSKTSAGWKARSGSPGVYEIVREPCSVSWRVKAIVRFTTAEGHIYGIAVCRRKNSPNRRVPLSEGYAVIRYTWLRNDDVRIPAKHAV